MSMYARAPFKIVPQQLGDLTESALHAVIDLADVFDRAVTEAESSGRCIQISRRLSACIEALTNAQNRAQQRSNELPASELPPSEWGR